MSTDTQKVDVLAAWDALADSIANRRDECLERGQNFQADLYRDMLSNHREARAAVYELIESSRDLQKAMDEQETGKFDVTPSKNFLLADARHRAALARIGGAA